MSVPGTDLFELRRMRFLIDVADGIGAEKCERVKVGQVVPQLFQSDGRLGIAVAPKDIDHFAIRADREFSSWCGSLLDHSADAGPEALLIGHRAHHERVEHFSGVEEDHSLGAYTFSFERGHE